MLESNSISIKMFIGFLALVRKEVYRIFRIWQQTIIAPVVTTFLYFSIFGSFIGQKIGNINGDSYINFIAPGLILMAIITNSYGNVSSSVFGNKFQRSIEILWISPMPMFSILLGFIIAGVVRGLLVGFVVFLTSLFFVEFEIYNFSLMITIAFLTAWIFSCIGFLNGLFANSFDDISIVPNFILVPLIYLGGVFYSISFLSEFWQTISYLNPIFYLINSFRYSFLGVSDIGFIDALVAVFCFSFILFFLNLYLLKKGIGIKN